MANPQPSRQLGPRRPQSVPKQWANPVKPGASLTHRTGQLAQTDPLPATVVPLRPAPLRAGAATPVLRPQRVTPPSTGSQVADQQLAAPPVLMPRRDLTQASPAQPGVGGPRNLSPVPVPVTGPAPNDATRFKALTQQAGEAVGKAAGGVWNQIKADPSGVANAAIGLAGAISYATAKAPKLEAPRQFTPGLRAARGLDEASLGMAREDIERTRRQATEAQGPDTQANIRQRLSAAREAGRSRQELSLRNAEAYRQDADRLEQQRLQIAEGNFTRADNYRQQNNELAMRRYESRRATAGQMVQGAVTYGAQANAAQRQEAQQQVSAQNRLGERRLQTLLIQQQRPGISAEEQARIQKQIDAIDAEAERQAGGARRNRLGGLLPRFGKGGKIISTTTIGPARRDPSERIMEEFMRGMNKITVQAQQQFGALVRQKLAVNTKPLARR